jgi:hypothetical protein
MKWFKITVSPAQAANNELSILQNQFVEVFMAAEQPKNMALFSSQSSPNVFYICASKAALSCVNVIIDFYNADPCDKPADEKLNLLAGNAAHIEKLLANSL